jgi:hypothetical protein
MQSDLPDNCKYGCNSDTSGATPENCKISTHKCPDGDKNKGISANPKDIK